MRKEIYLLWAVVIGVMFTSACATKTYVRKHVEEQVVALEGSIEELEEITKTNAGNIKDVDVRAQKGIEETLGKVEVADAKAVQADSKATAAGEDLNSVASAIAALDQYKMVESQQVQFGFDKDSLGEESIAALNRIGEKIGSTNHYVVELRGFTDTTGAQNYNLSLAQRRADVVRRYLIENYKVPLYRIFVEGFGESMPMADNKTRSGRAANRRVEVNLRVSVGAEQVAQR